MLLANRFAVAARLYNQPTDEPGRSLYERNTLAHCASDSSSAT